MSKRNIIKLLFFAPIATYIGLSQFSFIYREKINNNYNQNIDDIYWEDINIYSSNDSFKIKSPERNGIKNNKTIKLTSFDNEVIKNIVNCNFFSEGVSFNIKADRWHSWYESTTGNYDEYAANWEEHSNVYSNIDKDIKKVLENNCNYHDVYSDSGSQNNFNDGGSVSVNAKIKLNYKIEKNKLFLLSDISYSCSNSNGWAGWMKAGIIEQMSNINLYVSVPNLKEIYSQFINIFSKKNNNMDANYFYKISESNEIWLSNEEKEEKLTFFYKKAIEKLFLEVDAKNKFTPNNWDIKVYEKNNKYYLKFLYKDFHDIWQSIETEIITDIKFDWSWLTFNQNLIYSWRDIYQDKNIFADEIFHIINEFYNSNSNNEYIKAISDFIIGEKNEANKTININTNIISKEWWIKNISPYSGCNKEKQFYFDYKDENYQHYEFNCISKISNGEIKLSIKPGEDLYNNSFNNNLSTNQVYFYIKDLKTQFDIYKNNESLNESEYSSKSKKEIYNNYSIDISDIFDNKNDYDEIYDLRDVKNIEELKQFIKDELILYDNQNGERLINSYRKNKYIFATNLNKEDFYSREIINENDKIKNINIEDIDKVNGRFIFSISNLDMGTPWREEKINIDGFSKTYQEIDGGNNKIYFAISGFKKHFDLIQNKNRELDADKLSFIDDNESNITEKDLSEFNALDVENAALNKSNKIENDLSFDDLISSLINFKHDIFDNDIKFNKFKLLNTFLDKEDFINYMNPEFLEDSIERHDVIGSITLDLAMPNEENVFNYNEDVLVINNSNINQYGEVIKSNLLNFTINGLKQNILLTKFDEDNTDNNYTLTSNSSLRSYTVNQIINKHNEDPYFLLKDIFQTNDNFDGSLFSLNGSLKELYNESNGVIKDIKFENINNPMGEMSIRFIFNQVNGTFNGKEYIKQEGAEKPEDLVINLKGFKKDINVSNRVVKLDVNEYNKSTINTNRTPINDMSEINERFIIDNLIKYSDYGWNNNNLLETNLKKSEFESYLLDKNKNGIEIYQNRSKGIVEGVIHLNEHNGWKPMRSLMDSFVGDINFTISGFETADEYFQANNVTLDISNYTDDFSSISLNDFDKSFILEKMIKYGDYNKNLSKPLLTTNVSKVNFVNKYLEDMKISKNNSNKSASVLFRVRNSDGTIKEIRSSNIINFEASTYFDVTNKINHLLPEDIKIDEINEDYIINNLISFETSITKGNKIITTNITKEEFIDSYLDEIVIKSNEEDKFNNQIKFSMSLKKPINYQLKYDFTVNVRTDKAYVNLNKNEFFVPQHILNKNMDEINVDDIKSLIKTSDNNISNYLFAINVNKVDLDKYVDIIINKNQKLGLVELDFKFKDIGNSDENVQNLKMNLSGFKNNVNFELVNNTIDINWYPVFDNINSLNEIDEQFIIDNLIKYEDDSNDKPNIIGSVNLTKEEFLKFYDTIEIQNNGNKISVSIKFKNNINYSKTVSSNEVNFEITDNSLIKIEDNSSTIIALSVSIPLAVIFLIVLIVILVKIYKKRKFKMEVDNEI